LVVSTAAIIVVSTTTVIFVSAPLPSRPPPIGGQLGHGVDYNGREKSGI